MDGIDVLPKACGEAGEAVRTLSLIGTGNLPSVRFTNPSHPLLTRRMEEICRYDIGKRRMYDVALVKNTAAQTFQYTACGQASILKKYMLSAFIPPIKRIFQRIKKC